MGDDANAGIGVAPRYTIARKVREPETASPTPETDALPSARPEAFRAGGEGS